MIRRLTAATLLVLPTTLAAQTRFRVEETSISAVHAAMKSGRLTCRALVRAYLDRIDRYDKRGPAINAITVVNPDALAIADSLDKAYAKTKQFVGPLHCIPMIVKDNFQTVGLQTSAGNLALAGYTPLEDAFEVKRIKDAGAIVLAKSNMAEFAFSPYETVNSLLPGYTKNPYALDRVTAGSSGGTAAAVASDFGEVGLGTDTGNSIRGPSSHQALVGIRSTMGLTSRAGIVPLSLFADIAGPMARSVADAVAVFQVVAGYDPNDTATDAVKDKVLPNYLASLVPGGLKGARIGVLRQAWMRSPLDTGVAVVFDRALADLRRGGATVLDTVMVPELDSIQRAGRGFCNPFKYEFEQWLAEQHGRAPVKSLEEIIRSGKYHPSIQTRLEAAERVTTAPDSTPACQARQRTRDGLRAATTRMMDSLHLDVVIYPTWSNPPRLIGDLNKQAGDNSQVFSPTTGMPAMTVPMGWTRNNTLPAGLTFLARAFDEPRMFRIAYGYEQATHWRREPRTVTGR
ncbi:MAG TPA: amidase family protein [Gemmatimonadaceae bacterium]|nr:amidase family protein [Gemmatimonadaceae bacterium]